MAGKQQSNAQRRIRQGPGELLPGCPWALTAPLARFDDSDERGTGSQPCGLGG
jgi:hypothetical protein